jgi:hypothetical protein
MVYTLDELRERVAPVAARYGLKAVYVFGSYATGTATEDSDVDLLVDTAGTQLHSLFSLGALYCDLEQALQKKIDLITLSSLEQDARMESDRIFRAQVERERMKLYAVA